MVGGTAATKETTIRPKNTLLCNMAPFLIVGE